MTLKKWATLTELFVDQMIIRLTGSPNSDQISIRRTLITHQARKLGWLLKLGLQQQVPSTLIRWSPDQTAWRASAPAELESGGTREGQSEGTDSIRPPGRARRCTVQYSTILLLCIPAPLLDMEDTLCSSIRWLELGSNSDWIHTRDDIVQVFYQTTGISSDMTIRYVKIHCSITQITRHTSD